MKRVDSDSTNYIMLQFGSQQVSAASFQFSLHYLADIEPQLLPTSVIHPLGTFCERV